MDVTGLVKFDAAVRAIEKAADIDEVLDIRDQAEALRKYLAQRESGVHMQNRAAYIKIRAEREYGKRRKKGDKNKGGKPDLKAKTATGSIVEPVKNTIPTRADLGVSKADDHNWQAMGNEVSDKEFEAYYKKTDDKEKEVTSAAVLRMAKANKPKPETPPLPKDTYDIIYADPPWQYHVGEQHAEAGTVQETTLSTHYPSMSLKAICELPVSDMAADNAVLFLWVTSPLLEECFAVIKAWGFTYKASFVWDKVKHNVGHYNSVRHEFLLICTKGSFMPQNKKLYDSVVSIERTRHSEKPEKFRQIIESLYPSGKRIELFARKKVKGWTSYGNDSRV